MTQSSVELIYTNHSVALRHRPAIRVWLSVLVLVFAYANLGQSLTAVGQTQTNEAANQEVANPTAEQAEPTTESAAQTNETTEPVQTEPVQTEPVETKPTTNQPSPNSPTQETDSADEQAKPKEDMTWWEETWAIPEARWIIWIFITVTLVMLAVFFAKNFREMAFGRGAGKASNSDFMTEFGKLRDQGMLGDDEYAKLKKTLVQSETGSKNSSDSDSSTKSETVNNTTPENKTGANPDSSSQIDFEEQSDDKDND